MKTAIVLLCLATITSPDVRKETGQEANQNTEGGSSNESGISQQPVEPNRLGTTIPLIQQKKADQNIEGNGFGISSEQTGALQPALSDQKAESRNDNPPMTSDPGYFERVFVQRLETLGEKEFNDERRYAEATLVEIKKAIERYRLEKRNGTLIVEDEDWLAEMEKDLIPRLERLLQQKKEEETIKSFPLEADQQHRMLVIAGISFIITLALLVILLFLSRKKR